jgi:hypothetical protein
MQSSQNLFCCSRAAPMQKAEIVEYVTKLTGAVTLAIGDGMYIIFYELYKFYKLIKINIIQEQMM